MDLMDIFKLWFFKQRYNELEATCVKVLGREWIDATETNGIFVSKTSFIHPILTLDSEELQGFAIADPHATLVL